MTTRPLRLDRSLLAAHRPGALLAVELGAAASIPRRRPRSYQVRAVEQIAAGAVGILPPPAPGVAVVEVRGVLEQRASWYSCGETCGYDELEERFVAAAFDPGVGSILLDVDSPGGDDPGLDQGVARMRAAKEACGKPVLGYVNEYAASAACWLLAGVCDGIYLPRTGRIGSIACVVIHETDARAIAEAGTDVYVGRGLPGKMKPNGVEPLDELGKARIDALAAAGTERIIAAMVAYRGDRGVTADAIRAWNGALFTGPDAVAAGLADGVGSREETISLAANWPRKGA